ncbi:hypothetical protein ACHWQZ_G006017 [Mnemiopsis leidyi]
MVVTDTTEERKVKKKGLKKKKESLKGEDSTKKKKTKKKKTVTFKEDTSHETIDAFISNIRQETETKSKESTEDPRDSSKIAELETSDHEDIHEEITDPEKHNILLKNFGIEEKKKKVKEKTLPVEPTDKELDGKVTISDLISSASKAEPLKAVQQLLDSGSDAKTLDEPLPRFQQDQAEREVNYDKSKKEVSKWLPLVKRNRESTHMSFPLYHTQNTKEREDLSSFANKRKKPTNKLEEEIYEALEADAHVIERPDHFLTEAEEKSLEELNAEEAELRREELCKMRALLSYQEEKFRRKNKIKSKKYRKILKKERQKKEEKELSDALKANPDVACEEADKADYLRALERISQKHKVGGKWNKNLLHKQIKDPGLKEAMKEQQQLRQKLMEKQVISSDEEEEQEEANREVEKGSNQPEESGENKDQEEFEVDPSNPWLVVGSALSGQTELPKPPPASNRELNKPRDQIDDVGVSEGKSSAVSGEDAENAASDDEESESGDDSDEEDGGDDQDKNKEAGKKVESAKIVRNVPSLEQEMLVDMAFANDDVVAQFKEEKEKIVDEETEKDLDITLPGWGSWAGVGTNDQPQKRIIKKAAPTAPRKDSGLDHVIINTKKNRKLQPHLVRHLPHPYKNRSVIEREMRQPIGPQWNSIRAFKNMIKPLESTVDGRVIEPMTAPKGFDKVMIRGKRKAVGS